MSYRLPEQDPMALACGMLHVLTALYGNVERQPEYVTPFICSRLGKLVPMGVFFWILPQSLSVRLGKDTRQFTWRTGTAWVLSKSCSVPAAQPQ